MKNFSLSTLSLLLISASSVSFADSAIIFNPDNSHYYQRFDNTAINWTLAKNNCSALKAHLATFTDNAEHNFVYKQLVSKAPVVSGKTFYLGATFDATKVQWSWITGEKFNYSFSFGNSTYRYMVMMAFNGDWGYATESGNSFYSGNPNYTTGGYVCEWDGNHFVDNATVPDLNGNGVDETASLYVDYTNGKHTVVIRDLKTHETLSTLTFSTSLTPPVGMAVIADINGNGIPEIAVLTTKRTVQIKDAKDNKKMLSSISFLNKKYQPRAITVIPDNNGNSADELTVLGISQGGQALSETRDSSTGLKRFSDTF